MIQSVLIVDDQPADRMIARRMIAKAGLRPRFFEFPDAESALRYLSDAVRFRAECGPFPPPALMLVDVKMPRMSGLALLERLQESIESRRLPADSISVLTFTSSSNPADVDRAKAFPFTMDCFVKPLSVEAVRAIVERYSSPPGG